MGAELRAALPLGRSTAITKKGAGSQRSVTLNPSRVTEIYLQSLKGSHIGFSMECFLEEEEEGLQRQREFRGIVKTHKSCIDVIHSYQLHLLLENLCSAGIQNEVEILL